MAKTCQPKAPYVKAPVGSEPVTNVPGTGSGKRADINAPTGGMRSRLGRQAPYVTSPPAATR